MTAPLLDPTTPSIAMIRGQEYPDASAEPKRKIEYVEQLWRDGESEALPRYKLAIKHILYANNKQWISWDTRKKQFDEMPGGRTELRVTMNYIKPILRARASRLLSGEVNFRAIPKANSYAARDKARIAVDFWSSRWKSLDMDHKVRRALEQSFCTGVVALKSFWNPNIGPLTPATLLLPDEMTGEMIEVPVDGQGEPVQDPAQAFQFRPGDTDTAVRSTFNLRMNPEATGWTEAEGFRWLIDTDVVPLAWAREKYPGVASEITASQGNETALTYERMAMGSQIPRDPARPTTGNAASQSTTQQTAKELTTIREYWECRSQFFPSGRLIVTVGGACAYDGDWPQGIFPYAPVFDEPAEMSPWGRASVTDMTSPQDVINREWTAVVKEMADAGKGQFVAYDVHGIPDQITTEDGAIIKIPMRGMAAQRSIKDMFARLDPAMVPADRWRMIEQAKITLFDIGAYHEVTRGQIPPGLDSGVAIEKLLESETGQLKSAVDALERTILLWARHQLAIARWGYGSNEQRWLPVERPDLGFMVQGVTGEELPDPDELDANLEYFRPTSEAAQRAEVKELFQLGALDQRTVLKVLDLGLGIEGALATQTRHYARARVENLAFERGFIQMVPGPAVIDPMSGAMMPGMPTFVRIDEDSGEPIPLHLNGHDDDLIHIDVHQDIALDESKPWAMRQLVLAHIEEHQQAYAAMQAALAPPPMEPDGDDAGSGQPPQE